MIEGLVAHRSERDPYKVGVKSSILFKSTSLFMIKLPVTIRTKTNLVIECVAQLAEPEAFNFQVAGSKPATLTNFRRKKMKKECIVELRAAEGGDDAKLLIVDQFKLYKTLTTKHSC